MSREAGAKRLSAAAAASFDPDTPLSRRREWIFGLILVSAVIAAYQPVWFAGFIWDDDVYVTGNPLLSVPDGLRRIWFSSASPSQYFPLTYTVFRMQYAVWGLNSSGYHWFNILLHAANALLVWRLLRRLAVPGAWLGAAIWSLHPVQVESVAWVTELKNVMMCFFFLLTLHAWIEFVDEQSGRRWKHYMLALAVYALALFSKTTACTIPVALLLVVWLKGKPIRRRRLAEIIPFAGLGIIMGLVAVWWERYRMGTREEMFGMGMAERILLASRATWFYIGKLLWPANLMFSYPSWTVSTRDPLAYLWLTAIICLIVIMLFARRYAGRSVEVAAVFFVATLTPMLGFLMLYTFHYSFVADHYQYVASIGPIALASAGMAGFGRPVARDRRWMKIASAAGLMLTLGAVSWRHATAFNSIETIWTDTLSKNPGSWLAHNNLGNAFIRSGAVDKAIAHYQRVLEIKPDYAVGHFNLANALLQDGQEGGAISHYEIALRIKSDYAKAQSNLAFVLATSSQTSLRNGYRAVELAKRALQSGGGESAVTLRALAAAYAETGQYNNAVQTAKRAIRLTQTSGPPELAVRLDHELNLYSAGLSFHR